MGLAQRTSMGLGSRGSRSLSDKERSLQKERRDAVAEFFPAIAFTIPNTIIYIAREPLKNVNRSTSRAITAEVFNGLRPVVSS
ncbi:unnamed protein product [Symbiodinium natans]|uniref:Uncharacterized protein n=1 Tax=Symbiodinium natans TaxID=878477 RepID=A0A812RG71_9DINO|nr:unnamed protein product [Symbiodinium natans]